MSIFGSFSGSSPDVSAGGMGAYVAALKAFRLFERAGAPYTTIMTAGPADTRTWVQVRGAPTSTLIHIFGKSLAAIATQHAVWFHAVPSSNPRWGRLIHEGWTILEFER